MIDPLSTFAESILGNILNLVAKKVGDLNKRGKIKRDFNNEALQNRYYKVYVPLRTLLLETHITGASRGYLFSQRIKNALQSFKKLKIKQGIRWLDRNYVTNQLYEVEFGREFPLDEIKKVVKENGKWTDSILLNLIQAADRASYEKVAYSYTKEDADFLEIQEFELAKYIWDTYEKLNKRLVPPA